MDKLQETCHDTTTVGAEKAALSHRAKVDDSFTPISTLPNEFLQMLLSNVLIGVCCECHVGSILKRPHYTQLSFLCFQNIILK